MNSLRVSRSILLGVVVVSGIAGSCGRAEKGDAGAPVPTGQSGYGTIKGHVRLNGTPPPNDRIRMRADPMCDKANNGQTILDQAVVASADGSLGNVFVKLQGEFPGAPVRKEPVTIDQVGCVYVPRVAGLQLGQGLQIRNSDPGLHNVHGVSKGDDGFNVGQPMAGMINTFKLSTEGITRLQCDVHTWMVAFIGVVSHPYFAVTGPDGTFELRDVPAGMHSIQAWHEQYGVLSSSARVDANGITTVEFVYPPAPGSSSASR